MKAIRIALLITYILISNNLLSQTDTGKQDSLLKIIQGEMNQVSTNGNSSRSLSISNPRISVIGDMQTWYRPALNKAIGASLQEMEFAFQSAVDPYARADVFFTVEHNAETGENSAGIEEAYLTTLSLPAQLQLRAGRIKPAFGRINTPHSHSNHFLDYPGSWTRLFGAGLTGDGFSLSWLLPQTLFYQELTAEVMNGAIESPVFSTSPQAGLLYSAHLKNFFELNENITLELGFSALSGTNDSAATSNILGGDLTIKWKPLQMNTYKSITWQSEIYLASLGLGSMERAQSIGMYSLLSWQFAKRWIATGRYDYSNVFNGNPLKHPWTAALLIGWYATEFQKLEIESSWNSQNTGQNGPGVKLRWIFVIGSHGAHQY